MKAILALGAALIAAPLFASPTGGSLPGVSDKETTIPYRDIKQALRGHGDVFYVKDRVNHWYRVQLNAGCADGATDANGLVFRHHGASRQIDRFTTVLVGGAGTSCSIKSIRKSQPPQKIDSKSPVTMN